MAAGVTYPREVEPPFGLPDGWKAIERAYTASSKSYGKTYIRYDSPNGKHKAVSSVKDTIKRDAEDKGLDAAKALQEYLDAVQEAKDTTKRKREELGQVRGEAREEAVAAFRQKYGELNGATVSKLPNWRAESVFRETCGQTAVYYYSPDGTQYGTVKSVEAYFGMQVLAGQKLPEIDEARSKVKLDERGRPIHEARQEINYSRSADGETKVQKRPRTLFADEEYHQSKLLVTAREAISSKARDSTGLTAADVEALQRSAEEMTQLLRQRSFEEPGLKTPGLVLAAVGCPSSHPFASVLRGLFFQLPEQWNSRPCYQSILVTPEGALACKGVYIFWSAMRSCWKIGPLNDRKAGFAFCSDDRPLPTEVESGWKIYNPS